MYKAIVVIYVCFFFSIKLTVLFLQYFFSCRNITACLIFFFRIFNSFIVFVLKMFNWFARHVSSFRHSVANLKFLKQKWQKFHVNMMFQSWNTFKKTIQNWSIFDKFNYKMHKKNNIRIHYVCEIAECFWKIKTTTNYDTFIENNYSCIMKLHSIYQCFIVENIDASIVNKQKWIQQTIFKFMKMKSNIKFAVIKRCIAFNYHENIFYQIILRVKMIFVDDNFDAHRYAFQLLFDYLNTLQRIDSNDYFHLKMNAYDHIFLRCFVCFFSMNRIYVNCRNFVAVDDAHLTNKFAIILLLIVDFDVNNKMTILIWKIVEKKNFAVWFYFFIHFKIAISKFVRQKNVLMSNRIKKLDEFHTRLKLNQWIHHVKCCRHIKENVSTNQ